MSTVSSLLAERSVLVCCGAGGVGKTTISAALGVAGALSGRRTCVLTVDPARRLGDALGVEALSNVPREIPGEYAGSLHAVMLDAARTFDDLVRHYAKDEEQQERILTNRLYQNLATSLSGTQEYMAMEKLFELHESGAFDLVIVDTPPTHSALDFLDAPNRLTGLLGNRVFRLIVAPSSPYLRAVSIASQVLLRTVTKVVGSDMVDDTLKFFQAFEGMEAGFKDRAEHVERLLSDATTGFVLVAAPNRAATEDANYFAERLVDTKRHIDALVVNRVQPDFGPPIDAGVPGTGGAAWKELTENLAQLAVVHERELAQISELRRCVGSALVVEVPVLSSEVDDLASLQVVARHLLD